MIKQNGSLVLGVNYPLKINDRVAQAVAISVFTITFTTVIRPDLYWLFIPLFIEFVLRYIHPKLSPFVYLFTIIDTNLLKNEPKYYYSPPKRFAVFIGIVLTGALSILVFFPIMIFQLTLSFILLVASFFQGFFNYCVGCKVYDILVRYGYRRNYKLNYSS